MREVNCIGQGEKLNSHIRSGSCRSPLRSPQAWLAFSCPEMRHPFQKLTAAFKLSTSSSVTLGKVAPFAEDDSGTKLSCQQHVLLVGGR